jgi:transcriptional regulator with XRE-family HTH domain
MQTVSEIVVAAREQAGLSRAELAAAAGLSRWTVIRLEQGDQRPTLETLGRLADALRLDLRALANAALMDDHHLTGG